jgi:hypothetical protein
VVGGLPMLNGVFELMKKEYVDSQRYKFHLMNDISS